MGSNPKCQHILKDEPTSTCNFKLDGDEDGVPVGWLTDARAVLQLADGFLKHPEEWPLARGKEFGGLPMPYSSSLWITWYPFQTFHRLCLMWKPKPGVCFLQHACQTMIRGRSLEASPFACNPLTNFTVSENVALCWWQAALWADDISCCEILRVTVSVKIPVLFQNPSHHSCVL